MLITYTVYIVLTMAINCCNMHSYSINKSSIHTYIVQKNLYGFHRVSKAFPIKFLTTVYFHKYIIEAKNKSFP